MTYNLRSLFKNFQHDINNQNLINDNQSNQLPIYKYKKTITPYKDALMKGLFKPKFKNHNFHYYKKLGDKINQLVDQQSSTRSYKYWWIEEYIRDINIHNDKFLQTKKYIIC